MNEIANVSNHLTAIGATDLLVPEDIWEVVSFSDIINKQQSKRNSVLNAALDIITGLASGETAAKGLKKDVRYVVDMSDGLKREIQAGNIKLDTNKDGEIFAQLRDSKGHFGKKLPIKSELVSAGIDPLQFVQIMQMKALEQKLNSVLCVLDDIGEDVAYVLQGQQNDRIALYNSGLNLFLEAQNIQNETFRMLVESQALKALSDGTEQLVQDLKTNVQYLTEGKYRSSKGKSTECIEEKITSINKCFDVIHRSYLLKTAIYYSRGETQAMLSAMDEYGKFLSREIIPNADKLTEFDSSDKLLQNGRWEKRAALLPEISEVRKQLAAPEAYFIGIEESENG